MHRLSLLREISHWQVPLLDLIIIIQQRLVSMPFGAAHLDDFEVQTQSHLLLLLRAQHFNSLEFSLSFSESDAHKDYLCSVYTSFLLRAENFTIARNTLKLN